MNFHDENYLTNNNSTKVVFLRALGAYWAYIRNNMWDQLLCWVYLHCSANMRSMSDWVIPLEEWLSPSLRLCTRLASFLRFFSLGVSPQMFEPPYILGMLRIAIPSKGGPLPRSNDTLSHCNKKRQNLCDENDREQKFDTQMPDISIGYNISPYEEFQLW